MYLVLIGVVAVLIVIAAIICLGYAVTAASQQTLTLTIPFEDTYRYVPNLNKERKFKLDSIKVTVTGSIKKDALTGATISPAGHVRKLLEEAIIEPNKNCLIIHEASTFDVTENSLKRCPIVKTPTLENLSVMFFNKLSPLARHIGCHLVSVKLVSEGTSITHSRYKMSDYKV